MMRSFSNSGIVAVAILTALAAGAQDFDSPRLEAVTSWIGNTYGGGQKWVQQDIHALTVTADGTVFTNVLWDEGGGNVGEYKDGELIRYARHTHGWGANGGEAVAANSKYLFFGMEMGNEGGKLSDPETWPPKGSRWFGISRRTRSDISKAAPFTGGKGGKGDTLKESMLVVAEVADKTGEPISGICADETRLYVADPNEKKMKVFDTETMQPVTSWKIQRAGPLAMDPSGTVWMLERRTDSASAHLVRFMPEVGAVLVPVEIGPDADPVALCFVSDGRLALVDDGPAQQIRLFKSEANEWREAGTFGERGGIAGGTPGAFADRKFNRVTAIGCDKAGNVVVAQDGQSGGGGTVLESYWLNDGKLNWRLFGLTFVDMADIDAKSDADVFTKEEHFHLDYSQPAGREASYAGFTIGREKYPQDPRLHIWSGGAWVRQVDGRRLLFVNDMNAENLQVYRFAPATDGEVAIPSSFFAKKHLKTKDTSKDVWPPNQPEKGAWIWRDGNGNGSFDADEFQAHEGEDAPASQGWWVDQAGNVWLATEKEGLRFFPLQGFDSHGNPKWDYATMRSFPQPEGFREVKRLRYDAATDTMFLGGTTDEDKNQHWKPMGPVVACYDGWLRGRSSLRWRAVLPYARGTSGHESCEPMGFDVAGEYVFVPYTGASKKNNVRTGRVELFRVSDGSAAGHFEPGPEVGEIGLQDLRETLTAHRRADGEYVVLLEDDYKSKVVMYRFATARLPNPASPSPTPPRPPR